MSVLQRHPSIVRLALVLLLAGTLGASGCASSGGGMLPPPEEDAGRARDAGVPSDGGLGVDSGIVERDAGGGGCGVGQHMCGAGCLDDLPNDALRGCRFGCGEPCPMPAHATASCTPMGACDFTCDPPFTLVAGACMCTPRTCTGMMLTCGAADDGCGMTLDCGTCTDGAMCMAGTCGCAPDSAEPDETAVSPRMVGMLTDVPDSSLTLDTYSLGSATDQDWLAIHVSDNCCDANPIARVTLDRIPMGANYDLAAFYVCDSGGDSSTCNAGMPDSTVGAGCSSAAGGTTIETVEVATECSGLDEGGTLLIRVTAASWARTCIAYRVQVDVT